jgi:hypothetical protein
MPVILIDGVESVTQGEASGVQAYSTKIEARIAQALVTLRAADPDLWWEQNADGSPDIAGDGLLLLAHSELAAQVIRAAVTIQIDVGVKLHVAMGIGDITWRDPTRPWAKDNRFRGQVVGLVARLKEICPAGAIVINEGLYREIEDTEPLVDLVEIKQGTFKGFLGQRLYGEIRLGRRDAPATEKVIRDESLKLRDDVIAAVSRVDGRYAALEQRQQDAEKSWSSRVDTIVRQLGMLVHWQWALTGGVGLCVMLIVLAALRGRL